MPLYWNEGISIFVKENPQSALFIVWANNRNIAAKRICLICCFENQIVEYIVQNGMMKDMMVLQGAPFTDRGSVIDVFADLSVWTGIRAVIENINANGAA